MITTKQDFLKYCLRNLGAPVIQIDVTDEQLSDRYDEALKKFQDWHFNGTERTYYKHQVTQDDVDNRSIPLPTNITGVARVMPYNSSNAVTQSPFSIQYQLRLNDIWDMGSTSVTYYASLRSYTSMLDQMLNGSPIFRFNKYTDRLHIDTYWGQTLQVGNWVLAEVFVALDPEQYPEAFNDAWFKKYATALVKRQWGSNISKYQGVSLVGGITLNADQIYSQAMQEIQMLEQELMGNYQEPILPMVG